MLLTSIFSPKSGIDRVLVITIFVIVGLHLLVVIAGVADSEFLGGDLLPLNGQGCKLLSGKLKVAGRSFGRTAVGAQSVILEGSTVLRTNVTYAIVLDYCFHRLENICKCGFQGEEQKADLGLQTSCWNGCLT